MNPRLQHLFDILEADRHRLLEQVRQQPAGNFNYALPGKWSIAQILSHLLAAEKLSRLYMIKKILAVDQVGNTGLFEELKMVLLKLSQRLPFKFKAPRGVVEQTSTYTNIETLTDAWSQERAELARFLETIQDHQVRKKIYRHIRAGRLNVLHALVFIREHYIHHLPQIKRLL